MAVMKKNNSQKIPMNYEICEACADAWKKDGWKLLNIRIHKFEYGDYTQCECCRRNTDAIVRCTVMVDPF